VIRKIGKTGGDPVETARTEWETPEFDEIGCAPEVTMYVARMDD
jgi:coenzyme PQQ precursor peptide PqqA